MDNTVKRTFLVAFLLCLVCSVLVSSAAVVLRPTQAINKSLDKKRNILMAAGLMEEGADIDKLYERIEPKVVDMAAGRYAEGIDPQQYDQRKAAKDPAQSQAVEAGRDIASIKRQAKHASVYLVRKGDKIDQVILPVHGLGLWSTLYGFVSLSAKDLNTIKGLVYYEHAETPGLGGEVDNPAWKALWRGKIAYDKGGKVAIKVIKGKVNSSSPAAKHQVDGLSGATITARGVSNMLQYWLGEDGFGAFLENLRAQGGRHG